MSNPYHPACMQHMDHVVEVVVGRIIVVLLHPSQKGAQHVFLQAKLLYHATQHEQVLNQLQLCVYGGKAAVSRHKLSSTL